MANRSTTQTATGSGVTYGGDYLPSATSGPTTVGNVNTNSSRKTNTSIKAGDNNQITYTSSDPDVVQKAIDALANQNSQFLGSVTDLTNKSLTNQADVTSLFAGLDVNKATNGQGVVAATGETKTLADQMGMSQEKFKILAGIGIVAVIGFFALMLFRRP